MGTISTGVGIVSGIDTAGLIDQLLAIEARGKIPLQQRIATLQSRQSAMLDINARLLNLKNALQSFRKDQIFQSASATSSNTNVLTATARAGALPGTYSFIVDRLVSTSQQMSRGFSDIDSTGIGIGSMTFEVGRGKLESDIELAELNGGQGVRRGKIIITDRTGASVTVDLSRTGTIGEVIDAINGADGVSITASISGDGLRIIDTSGGAGTLQVQNGSGYFTATDLGIAGDGGAGTVMTGTSINTIGATTGLARLNDGNGVLINGGLGNADFVITDRLGNAHDIVLGQWDNGGEIEDAVATIQDVIDRIGDITAGAVTAVVASDGVSLELTDTTGGAGLFSVTGTGSNGTATAADLGILETAGVSSNTISGERILAGLNSVLVKNLNGGQGLLIGSNSLTGATPLSSLLNGAGITTNGNASSPDIVVQDRTGATYEVEVDGLATAQDLIDAFNAATGGAVTLSINGNAFRVTNATTGASNFQVQDLNGASVASELGIVADNTTLDGDIVDGVDTNPVVSSQMTITDRNGNSALIDLAAAESASDIIALINNAGIGVQATLNSAGNGLLMTDTTGGANNLIITGDAAATLGIWTGDGGVASNTVRGSNLQHKYVSGSSLLSSLNYGRGVGNGSFRVIDGSGNSAIVEIGNDSKTLQDIISEINSKGLDILARVNDHGDGLLIESTAGAGALAIRVESVSGTTARDLGIVGTAADAETANFIDGSYERTVEFDANATLSEVVAAINDANVPVAASIINTGSGSTPHRITFTSEITGRTGDLSIDAGDFDLGLSTLSHGRDARVFFGSSDAANAVLINSKSNTLDKVVSKVNIDLVSASDSAVTLTVARDTAAMVDAVKEFVTTFNDAVGRLDQYDSYDAETEKRGPLLGDPTVGRVRGLVYRQLQRKPTGVDGPYQLLSQVGIRAGTKGELQFDETRFRAALENDFDAVADFFVAFEKEITTEDLGNGITTDRTTETYTRLGVAEQFYQLLEKLTNSIDGTMKVADDNFESQIDLAEKRIEAFDQRLLAKRDQLQRQFAAMENALAQLQNQQGALISLQNASLFASFNSARR